MFLQFYGLAEQPFGVTADPRFLYPSRSHQGALASLLCGIENDLGFTALVAEPGLGKTTLLFHVLETFRHTALSAFLFENQGNSIDLLRCLLKELNVRPEDKDSVTLHEQFRDALVGAARSGRRVIVILDEAQNLEPPVLEGVRLLSNFESRRAKLLHIILAGQPQLAARLAHPEMAQLQQRLSMMCWLKPLNPDDTACYIRHRLRVAGHSGESLFSEPALETIAVQSGGIPREINRICFNALSLGCVLKEACISQATVERVIADSGLPWRATQEIACSSPLRSAGNGNQTALPDPAIEISRDAPQQPVGSPSPGLDEMSSRPENAETADLLSNLALRYHKQGKYSEAEKLHLRALRIREKSLGLTHPRVATSLNNLALIYRDQGRLAEAQKLLERSLAIVGQAYGPDHPKATLRLNNLASLPHAPRGPQPSDSRGRHPVASEARPHRWWNILTTALFTLGLGASLCLQDVAFSLL